MYLILEFANNNNNNRRIYVTDVARCSNSAEYLVKLIYFMTVTANNDRLLNCCPFETVMLHQQLHQRFCNCCEGFCCDYQAKEENNRLLQKEVDTMQKTADGLRRR